MTAQLLAMLLMAAALVLAPGPAGPRSRLRSRPQRSATADSALGTHWVTGRGVVRHGIIRWARRSAGTNVQPLALAGAWELLAACLQAGMAVPVAVRAVAEGLEAPVGPALRASAELLALGADPTQAWQPALECTATARLAKAARRSGRSGIALAESLTRLAAQVRAGAREHSEARAQRAGVLIAAPLGLCFLPAFLAIGIVPVLIGLAAGLMRQW
ncbi:MAG: type II secretion system F family protein [Pseudonocardiales bacterium]|nr:type II secretion system F family protein [Pseudonocardiales bacterium]